MAQASNKAIRKTVFRQQALLLVEGLWHALRWSVLAVLLACAVLWSGLLEALPVPLPLIVLAALAAYFVFTLRSLSRLAGLNEAAALRRLESINALAHREASSLHDQMVVGTGGTELWSEFSRRKLAALTQLKLSPPKSKWRGNDPLGLVLPVAMLALVSFFLGSGHIASGLQGSIRFSPAVPPVPVVLDAWLKPPTYTGKPPVLLSSPAMADALKSGKDIVAPENSVMSLRLSGAANPHVAFYALGADGKELTDIHAKLATEGGALSAELPLIRPLSVKVSDGDVTLATYPIALLPDTPPTITFTGEPSGDDQGKLVVKWHATDDYGLKSVNAALSLADEQDGGTGFSGTGVFLYDAPVFKVALGKPGAKEDSQTSKADFTGHAWAGLYVEMVLTATDAAGHTASTPAKRFRLPERTFIKPLAQALVEQRKTFILDPEAAADASTMIGTMLMYPVDMADNTGLILNLSSINNRLVDATAPEDVLAVVKDIWPLIIAVEEGHSGDAKAELKELAQQLQQALREGAPQSKIDDLMARMRSAMKKLTQELQKEGQKRNAQGLKSQPGKTLTQRQLQDMLDQIGKMQKDGSKESAEQLLSQLDQLLQNLQPGTGQSAEGGDPRQDALDGLSKLMGKQRKLMDETQRMGQNGKGQKGQQGQQGQDGQDGEGGQGGRLGQRQTDLQGELGQMGKGLPGENGSDSLGEAGKSMGRAGDALRNGDKDEAMRQQNQAMRQLREGMDKLASQMGQDGKNGQTGNTGNNDDPLGRARGNTDGNNKILPSELLQRRARQILQELRNRSGNGTLDEDSRSYLNRLQQNQF